MTPSENRIEKYRKDMFLVMLLTLTKDELSDALMAYFRPMLDELVDDFVREYEDGLGFVKADEYNDRKKDAA